MTTTSEDTEAKAADPGQEPIPPELRIVEWQNEWIVRSAYEYDYQAKDDMLEELREKYELDAVVAGGRTEFEQMLLLKEWVRNRWDHGWSREPEARNALEILEAAELGSDFNCGYYSVTMMQSLLALGFVARRAGIAKAQSEWMALDEGNIGHSVPEVYSHDFHKWILLDADMNVHYELDGVPLSVLEIHRAWVDRRWNEVKMVTGAKPFKRTEKTSSGLLSVYDRRARRVGLGLQEQQCWRLLRERERVSRQHAPLAAWADADAALDRRAHSAAPDLRQQPQ